MILKGSNVLAYVQRLARYMMFCLLWLNLDTGTCEHSINVLYLLYILKNVQRIRIRLALQLSSVEQDAVYLHLASVDQHSI